jgi:hypothetical protein
MEPTLNSLEGSLLTATTWTQAGDLIIQAVDVNEHPVEVRFHNICFFKLVGSRVHDWNDSNEIWKLHEIADSPLLREVVSENGAYWLQQQFGGFYKRVTSVEDPRLLRHIVLLSDYLDLEILCTDCQIKES